MKKAANASADSGPPAVLRIAQSAPDAWSGAARAWFHDAARDAWKQPLPSLVVVPTRSHANALKARLLDEGVSHLGLRFATPHVLRDLLLREYDEPLPSREHLRLLLAIAAEQTLSTNAADGVAQAAKAVVRAPDHLLRTLERLAGAGWNFDELQLCAFQPIVRQFREHLQDSGFSLLSELNRTALQRSGEQPSLFARVLISGFDGAHWPHWFLLRAAVQAAETATVLLEYPRGDNEADAYWIGSWEEALGEALDVSAQSALSDSFFTDEEMRGLGRSQRDCTFLVGANTSQQAYAVAQQCVRFLAQPACTRIGIVFSGAGSLPRLVATALAELEIPHNDAIGHSVPGAFESADWRAWLQLQKGPRINSLLHFINALPNRAELFPGIRMEKFERALRSSYAEVLIDDLDVLQQFLAREGGGTKQLIVEALRSTHFLPKRATLAQFASATEAAFEALKWTARSMEILRRVDEWMARVSAAITRSLYLRWLGEIASTFSKSRDVVGEHPYARVQLLTVAEAHGQEWSHVIFSGWNEGSWPPLPPGEFVRDDEIAAFNRGIQKLNRRAKAQGYQGEGHSAIRQNHTFYLGPSEQRQIALRQFETLLNSATAAVAFSASLAQEDAPERFWNPSELLTRVYQQTHRKPLTQATMSNLQRATSAWLEHARTVTKKTESSPIQIEQTRVAYDARRDPNASAGEYDFAFRSAPAHVPVFSVSDLEKLVSTPGLIWMKKFLGVEAADESGSPWSAATGQWVHHWLAGIGGLEGSKTFARLPGAAEIDKRICKAAKEKAAEVAQLCGAAGKQLPDWWISGWQNALCLARTLAGKITTAKEWNWMATEWVIEPDQPVTIGNAKLSFRGRIDLLLARTESAPDLDVRELWILDYKTGSNKPLAPAKEDVEKRSTRLHNRLVKGEALQLGLYALAMRQGGADEVLLSIVSPAVRAVEPQLSSRDLVAHQDVFAELARMQRTGIFGMYGQLRPAFGYARPYPLATLAIDPDLLDEKWGRTHPALAREEEEWESW